MAAAGGAPRAPKAARRSSRPRCLTACAEEDSLAAGGLATQPRELVRLLLAVRLCCSTLLAMVLQSALAMSVLQVVEEGWCEPPVSLSYTVAVLHCLGVCCCMVHLFCIGLLCTGSGAAARKGGS